ncbi:DUF6452 family protein [Aquimarina intermedia]|uniref:Lipoprotein n=1 Tax=Aquimarina intermedia TaxID=350814 RepID=A0A5S5BSA2_9FLAO|nr:DUF6452 family protein [Aquimarina intermedia]TYP69939.1 hypothetical protein BD809_1153 [Aquimarina intermedia]
MRLKPYILISCLSLLSILLLTQVSCERDDICAPDTATTPLLVIAFISAETAEAEAPVELQIKGEGIDELLELGTALDTIRIPLRTNGTLSEFEFTVNSNVENDSIPANTDMVSFQYTTVEEYVSSACGFRATFEGLSATRENTTDTDNWINEIIVQSLNVKDETTTHVLIRH